MQDVRCLPGSDVAAASLAVAGVPFVDLSQQAEVLASDGLLSKNLCTRVFAFWSNCSHWQEAEERAGAIGLWCWSVCKAYRRQIRQVVCGLKRAHLPPRLALCTTARPQYNIGLAVCHLLR